MRHLTKSQIAQSNSPHLSLLFSLSAATIRQRKQIDQQKRCEENCTHSNNPNKKSKLTERDLGIRRIPPS